MPDTGGVFVALDRLERGGLIAPRRIEAENKPVKGVFTVTAKGEQMLKEVRAAAQKLAEALAAPTAEKRDG
jgi:DNA-binding PadR family transcriptional regulator